MFLTPENSKPSHRRKIRAAVSGATSQTPIEVVSGRGVPKVEGEGPYHTFKGKKGREGGICNSPGGALRAGYRVVYHASTRRIIVGRAWVIRHVPGCLEPICLEVVAS